MVKVRRWPRQEAPLSCSDFTLQEGSGRCGLAHPLNGQTLKCCAVFLLIIFNLVFIFVVIYMLCLSDFQNILRGEKEPYLWPRVSREIHGLSEEMAKTRSSFQLFRLDPG